MLVVIYPYQHYLVCLGLLKLSYTNAVAVVST